MKPEFKKTIVSAPSPTLKQRRILLSFILLLTVVLSQTFIDCRSTAALAESGSGRKAIAFQNSQIESLSRGELTLDKVRDLKAALVEKGTFKLRRYSSGGHSAVTVCDDASLESAIDGLLIQHWDRDNIMQAMAEYAVMKSKGGDAGFGLTEKNAWKRGLLASIRHHCKYRKRFLDIIDGKVDPADTMKRPHIRYNPVSLAELSDPWGHAQNDALSYVLFFLFHTAGKNDFDLKDEAHRLEAETFAVLVAHYFKKIRVWEDFEFGAWEDKRAEHASSIGTAIGALLEMRRYLEQHEPISAEIDGRKFVVTAKDLDDPVSRLRAKLDEVLPNEFIRSDKADKRADASPVRKVDAALVNALILGSFSGTPVVDDEMTEKIVSNIETDLMGPIGIARYPHDIWDGRADRRDLKPGEEAQWCHVSPMISVILGEMYLRTGDEKYLALQKDHFCRALAHVNNRWRIPEAYIVDQESRQWIADANEPLAWAQSATILAFLKMEESLMKQGGR